jgi:hypothetical protein
MLAQPFGLILKEWLQLRDRPGSPSCLENDGTVHLILPNLIIEPAHLCALLPQSLISEGAKV